MSTNYTPDDIAAVLADRTLADEAAYWIDAGYDAIPWGVDRDTAITDQATVESVTVDATSPWLREQQFWRALAAAI